MPHDADRLRLLEDRAEIFQIFADYADALDANDHHRYAALFATDGRLTAGLGEAIGPAAIEALLDEKRLPEIRAGKTPGWHITSNLRIEVDGDDARATALWFYLTTDEDTVPTVIQIGTYDDTLVREDGHWRLRQHKIGKLAGRSSKAAPPPTRLADLLRRVEALEVRG